MSGPGLALHRAGPHHRRGRGGVGSSRSPLRSPEEAGKAGVTLAPSPRSPRPALGGGGRSAPPHPEGKAPVGSSPPPPAAPHNGHGPPQGPSGNDGGWRGKAKCKEIDPPLPFPQLAGGGGGAFVSRGQGAEHHHQLITCLTAAYFYPPVVETAQGSRCLPHPPSPPPMLQREVLGLKPSFVFRLTRRGHPPTPG